MSSREGILAIDGDDSVAGFVRRAVERNREPELQRLVGELADLRRQPAGRDGDLSRTDGPAPRRVQNAQGSEQVVVIRERFAHPHDHEVADRARRESRAESETRIEGGVSLAAVDHSGPGGVSPTSLTSTLVPFHVRQPEPDPRFLQRRDCVSSRPARWRRTCSRRRNRPEWTRRGYGGRWVRRKAPGWPG